MIGAQTVTPPDRDRSEISLLGMIISIGAPLAAYYLLRMVGIQPLATLLIIAAFSVIGSGAQIIRSRKVVGMNSIFLLFTLIGIGQSLIHGSPRFLLTIDCVITGTSGMWFLMTARTHRPFAFVISRALLKRRFGLTRTSWAILWDQSPTFRRIWRVSTVVWGASTIVDALIRTGLAMTLPVDVVPVSSRAVWICTFIVLQIGTNIYYHRAGLWTILRTPRVEGAALAG